MSDWTFRSVDRRFGLYIPQSEADNILTHCCEAGPKETGGILFGWYTPGLECANVIITVSASLDCRQHRPRDA